MEEQSQNGTINESTHNVPEEIDEQIPSCSTNLDNPGYPGFIEAIRQAKRKKKSHDVSFQQHDIHLNEWWNYCLIEKKDPLETNLSVFIGYLEKKKNAGASLDDLKSIVSSVYLISSDMMADQIRTFSFIFLEYAKYLFVNTNSYPTPELLCQNKPKISSVQIENVTKSKLSESIVTSDDDSGTGVNDNNRIVPITETIDDQQIDVHANNPPTEMPTCSSESLVSTSPVLSPAVSSKLQTSLTSSTPALKSPIATPPLINNKHECNSATSNTVNQLTLDGIQCTIEPVQQISTSHEQNYQLLMSEVDNNVNGKQYITYTSQQSSDTPVLQQQVSIEGQFQQGSLDRSQKVYYNKADHNVIPEEHQTAKEVIKNIQLINVPTNNTKQLTMKNPPTQSIPLKKRIKHVVDDDDEPGSSYKKYLTTLIPVTIQKQKKALQQQQSTLPSANNVAPSTAPEYLSDTSIHSDHLSDKIRLINKTESYAYVQKAIDNPQTAIVQDHVEGNVVKMLVVMPKNEQRLIIFDLPNAKCTVNDLLEQAGILFNETTTVTLVKDSILKINYIVEISIVNSTETSDVNDELSNDDNELSDEKCLQDDDDNNIHAASTVNIEEPKYIDGKLAVCVKCGLPSIDFNRCYHCTKKIQNNPKTVSHTFQLAQKKDMMVSIDKFYKSVKVNNDIKNDNTKLNLHTTSIDSNNSSSNLNKKQPSIGNTNSNDIIENMTIYPARKSINKLDCPKLSSNNQATNTNNQQNKKLNDGIGEFINNNSTQVSTIISIEKPKYIDGKLAVCDNCGSSSIDFNRCYYCKKKIKINTKTKLDKSQPSQKKTMIYKIDKFYKKLSNNDTGDVENELSKDGSVFPDKKYLQAADDDLFNNDKENTRQNQKVQSVLMCHTVQIGSYKYTPQYRVIINTSGLILSVPLLEDKTKIVEVRVKHRHIVKVLIHSGNPVSKLFFYTNTKSASKIRKILGMNNPKGPYYDPAGENHTQKRITLFPKLLKRSSIDILIKLFSSNAYIID